MEKVTAPSINLYTTDELAQAVLTSFLNYINVRHPTNPITEFGPGTIVAQLAGAMGLDISSLYTVADAAIPALKPAHFAILGTEKQDASKATCDLTFSMVSPQIVDITIPIGTKVRTNDTSLTNQIYYLTTEAGVLEAGETSITLEAEAQLEGQAYRVRAGVLNVISSSLPYITSVTNTLSIGGYDAETDYEAADRLQGILQTYYVASSPSSYEALAEQVSGVYRAKSYRCTDYTAPTITTIGHTTLIVQGEANETDELIDSVETYLDDKWVGANYTHIHAPSYVLINITADVRIHTLDFSTVQTNIETAFSDAFKDWEWQLNVTPLDIKNIILSAEGVTTCRLTLPEDTVNMGKFGLPKLGTLMLTQWQ